MATAKIQLDFSVLSLTLATVTIFGWAIFLAICGTSLWLALLVVGVGPIGVYGWLIIVHASYASFAELVRSAIDIYRLDLLTALRQPLPISTDGEKRSWESLTRLALLDEHRDNIAFRHPLS